MTRFSGTLTNEIVGASWARRAYEHRPQYVWVFPLKVIAIAERVN
jgi:hypothetical protein